jgi:hypothetical protein
MASVFFQWTTLPACAPAACCNCTSTSPLASVTLRVSKLRRRVVRARAGAREGAVRARARASAASANGSKFYALQICRGVVCAHADAGKRNRSPRASAWTASTSRCADSANTLLSCRFGAASYVPALTLEKPLYARERADGLYKPITYLLFHFFDELFITVFSSLAFSVFVWFVVDLEARP